MATNRKHDDSNSPVPASDALWALTCVLGDIAVRVTRRRADAHAGETPETRRGAGNDPSAPTGGTR